MDKICIVGLGYVGLPLAHAFSAKYKVIGFDIIKERISELNRGYDRTLELTTEQVKEAINNGVQFITNIQEAKICNIYIIAVPTPIDKHKKPDLKLLLTASRTVATVLKKNDLVIYESTVYPGATEEECVPVLENQSGLKFNKDFYCGYSPERINPGDKERTITKILKVTSGSTKSIAKVVDSLYKSIVTVGTYSAPSIKIAEAAKAIENSQRDINIAFVNELAMIFNKMNIDTGEVLKAAATKWNFLPFKPGLVGGHCIGVDPYYLTHKAQEIGYNPEIILAGRRINDNMGAYIAGQIIKLIIKKRLKVQDTKVLVLGITFKEDCPDIRNSKVIDVINELKDFGCNVDVSDPLADELEVKLEYGISLIKSENINTKDYKVIILAVAHNQYLKMDLFSEGVIVYDIKGILEKYSVRL